MNYLERMEKALKKLCGEGLERVCELADIPPVLRMGSCADVSRMMLPATGIAKDRGIEIITYLNTTINENML